jgi:hypothetical protein
MRLIRYALFGLGLGLLLLAGSALIFDLGALKPLYEQVAGHYLKREVLLPLTSRYQAPTPMLHHWLRPSSLRCVWPCPRYSTRS